MADRTDFNVGSTGFLWRIRVRIRPDPANSNAGYTMKVNEAERMTLFIMQGIALFYYAAV